MPPKKKMKTITGGRYDVFFDWKDFDSKPKPRHIKLWEKKLAELAKEGTNAT